MSYEKSDAQDRRMQTALSILKCSFFIKVSHISAMYPMLISPQIWSTYVQDKSTEIDWAINQLFGVVYLYS